MGAGFEIWQGDQKGTPTFGPACGWKELFDEWGRRIGEEGMRVDVVGDCLDAVQPSRFERAPEATDLDLVVHGNARTVRV